MTQFERMQKKRGNADKIGDHLKPGICDYAEICNFEKLSRKSANSKNFNDKSEIFRFNSLPVCQANYGTGLI